MTSLAADTGSRFAAISRHRLVQNFGWFMAGELAVRVSRLLATIILARQLMPHDFGIAAIALTTYELVRVLSCCGLSAMIVRATADTFAATCVAVNRASYAVAVILMSLQILVGYSLAKITGHAELFAMLAWLSIAHLAVPLTDVRYGRLQRSNRLKALAAVMAAQVLLDNALTMVLALKGFGAWAVVLPKLLTTPLYVIMIWRADPSPLPRGIAPLPLASFLPFSLPLLATEILAALRLHLDKVLVGAVLGIEALGVYSFAFNAGLGLSMALTTAMTASLYPHLAEAARSGHSLDAAFSSALRTMVLPVCGLIAIQAALALLYVPIIFGDRWAFAAPLVALLCLSGILRPLYDATCQRFRAAGQTRRELFGATTFTVILLGLFAVALTQGLEMALITFTTASICGHIAFAIWARRAWSPGR